jgi:hypothetical protein
MHPSRWAIVLLLSSLPAALAYAAPPIPDDNDPEEPIATVPVKAPETSVEDQTLHEPPITAFDRDHWAFRPLVRAQPPTVKDQAWPAGAVDRFILAQLETKDLRPQPPADRRTLLRRVTFDLTGLPPTPEEAAEFLADDSPQAYKRVVDRLLASQAYGERWAQHWLDLARFAETDGFEHDKVRPQAWRYRDWVIEALNRDLPLDEFIRLQIAGDELEPEDKQAAIATGFLLAGPDMPDINLKEERRHMVLNEITSTVGSVFLGLQIGCAQCHDHKYDPISQADFYRLRSVFETAELFKTPSEGRMVRESGATPVSHLMVRGDFRRPGAKLEPAIPRVLNPTGEKLPSATYEQKLSKQKSSGRRTALAKWLTGSNQPVTTRVLVNWIWQQHFGKGLSRTPSDFGVMGEAPSHAELLDWLATELVREGWSLKRLQRILVTSATYQQASRPTPELDDKGLRSWQRTQTVDPENRLLGRMERRRLEGEAIRDAMLASSERLSSGRGGPGVMAPLPEEMLATLLKGQWKTSASEDDHRRRSIYLFVRRNLRYPLFEAFDRPDTNASCPRRNVSTTAPQALVLLNSEFSLSAARDLAAYVLQRAKSDPAARIELVYQRTLGRPATRAEIDSAQKFLVEQAARVRAAKDEKVSPETAALVGFCLAMFNLNEFIYLD